MKQDSWLYSDSFLRRSLAIYGYCMVGSLIVALPIMILWVIFMVSVVAPLFMQDGIDPSLLMENSVQVAP